jgi:hypothetical protein
MKKEEIHSQTLGYEPKDMKPVHLFTTFFLTIIGRAQRNEMLNRTAVVRNKKGLLEGYTLDGLHDRLLTEGRIADTLTKKELDLIRWQLHALLNNDQAMNAAFRPFKTFGSDYTGTSERFLPSQPLGWLCRYIHLRNSGCDAQRQRSPEIRAGDNYRTE